MKSVPLATACIVYHRFFKEYSLQEYDPYVCNSLKKHLKLHVLCQTCLKVHLYMMEETEVSGESHQPVISHWQTLSHNVVSCTRGSNSQL
jgi:hypothetical protein